MSLARRLRRVRTELGLSQNAMARKVGLSNYKSWSDYESGRSKPGADVLRELGRLGFRADWVLSGQGEMLVGRPVRAATETQATDDEFVFLPRYEVRAAGAGAIVHSEQVVDRLAFRRDWVEKDLGLDAKKVALIKAEGDSMVPTVGDGDLLLVNLSDQDVVRPGIFVLALGDELVVKRISRSVAGDSLVVASDNAAYGSQTLNRREAASLRIIGRVVWAGGRV